MGKTHRQQIELKAELDVASTQVQVGAQYQHYKAASKIYTVLNLAFQEENNQLSVIYRADYEERLIFIRPLASWLEYVEWQGETVPRFTKIET